MDRIFHLKAEIWDNIFKLVLNSLMYLHNSKL